MAALALVALTGLISAGCGSNAPSETGTASSSGSGSSSGTASSAGTGGGSFSVRRGERVAIVGPSGSGKSTLLHVMGILERPSSGVVRIGGVDAAGLSDREVSLLRAREIGFVFQQFFLAEHATVRRRSYPAC